MLNGTQRLTSAQLTTLQAELTGATPDPRALGYAGFITTSDWINLALLLNFLRDGTTVCPLNNVLGGPSGTITGATNASPIVITSNGHGLITGDGVLITSVGGNTAANGTWVITKVNNNSFSLNGSTGNGAYTSGGIWQWCVAGTRVTTVNQQAILGAMDLRDWPGWGTTTGSATPQQMAQLIFLQAVLNQPSGTVSLTNADGSDNNTAKNIKRAITNTNGSTTAVTALEARNGGRGEQLLSLSGDVQVQVYNGNNYNFSTLLDPLDVQAAVAGHY